MLKKIWIAQTEVHFSSHILSLLEFSYNNMTHNGYDENLNKTFYE